MENLKFINLLSQDSLKSLIIVLNEYRNIYNNVSEIESIYFNDETHYVCLKTYSNINIKSLYGDKPIYFNVDPEGNEIEHDNFDDCEEFLKTLNA